MKTDEEITQIASKVNDVIEQAKVTYYEALGILEVVKAYQVGRLIIETMKPGIMAFKVKP